MGIYGALSTAVTGLRAQSFALENISGNIANSQTTGFKRVDTDFLDLIPDQPKNIQTSGSVLAQSRATNTQQGDVKSVSNSTYMAVNGSGFFVVEPALGQSDGAAVFGGANYYTRRGDFEVDKSGYLVNGSGYYLKGLPIDTSTGNVSSSLPQVIRISNSFLPASPTTRINYQLNLPQLPKNAAYQETPIPGNELFHAQHFSNIPNNTNAKATGASAVTGDPATNFAADGNTLAITSGGNSVTITFAASGTSTGDTISLADTNTDSIDEVLTYITGRLVAAGAVDASASLVGGKIVIDAGNLNDELTVTDHTSGFGLTNGTTGPSVSLATQIAARVPTIKASDSDAFVDESISGGSITVYAANGAPANVQLRWAKISSTQTGGAEVWNLFYQSDSAATGSATKWTNVGTDFGFTGDGAPSPAVDQLDLGGLTVDGVSLGDLKLSFGKGGITQFNDPNGTAGVTALNQNGYPAGQFVSVAVDDDGRVVASYDNGQQVDIAQVITADFNASNQLKRLDGGIFAATADSGEPIYNVNGGVIGASLESSNTDISEEFTKLIVTQQAYAAGTKIVSTADDMLQQALNMLR